jgi:hypothetical protein
MYLSGACRRESANGDHRLMKEATINAKQTGERISAKSVKKVTEASLRYGYGF